MMGRIDRPSGYAHVLVDEAQDLSPMQWRMLVAPRARGIVDRRRRRGPGVLVRLRGGRSGARRGLRRAATRGVPHGHQPLQREGDLRLRRDVILQSSRADIPGCRGKSDWPTRSTERRRWVGGSAAADAVDQGIGEVEGSIAVTGEALGRSVAGLDGAERPGQVILPLDKGLEWDATVVVDPEARATSPHGGRHL